MGHFSIVALLVVNLFHAVTATTMSDVVEGHAQLLQNPREAAALFLAVIAFCALLTIALTRLEQASSPLLQSFFVASTRVIIVIGANSVLLSFVSGLFEAGKIDRTVLLVLHWVYFIFFFFMVGLVGFSLFGVLVIGLIVRRQAKVELRLIEEGEEARLTSANDSNPSFFNNESMFFGGNSMAGRSFAATRGRSATLLQNLSLAIKSEAQADLLRRLRFIFLQTAFVAFPHKISTIMHCRLADYVAALQQWDASTLTDLSKTDWLGIFATVVVNTVRVRIVVAVRGTGGTKTDFYSFFAVIGVVPCLVYIYCIGALFVGLYTYADSAFTNLVQIRLKRSSRIRAKTSDGIELFSSPHLVSTADLDSPAQFVPGQQFHVLASTAKMCLLQQLFYLILFALEFATSAGPMWAFFSVLPPLVVFATLPLMTLVVSLMNSLGASVQHGVLYKCLMKRDRDLQGGGVDGMMDDNAIELLAQSPAAMSGTAKAGVSVMRASALESGVGSSGGDAQQPTTSASASGRPTAELVETAARTAEEELEEEYEQVVSASIAALEVGRHQGEAPKPRGNPLDPARQHRTDVFHLYYALERCRTDYEAQSCRNTELEEQLRHELRTTAQIAKHLALLKDILTDRVSLADVPLESMAWQDLVSFVDAGGPQYAKATEKNTAFPRSLIEVSKPTADESAVRNRLSRVLFNESDL